MYWFILWSSSNECLNFCCRVNLRTLIRFIISYSYSLLDFDYDAFDYDSFIDRSGIWHPTSRSLRIACAEHQGLSYQSNWLWLNPHPIRNHLSHKWRDFCNGRSTCNTMKTCLFELQKLHYRRFLHLTVTGWFNSELACATGSLLRRAYRCETTKSSHPTGLDLSADTSQEWRVWSLAVLP